MAQSTSVVLDAAQEAFLRQHTLAVLATGRSDGSPQVSQIVYDYDGTDLAISVKSYTAKWKNTLKQPRVALLVHEGRQQLVLYGHARAIDSDPERIEKTVRVFRRLSNDPEFAADDNFVSTLDEQQRTVLCVTVDKAFMND